MGGWSGDVKAGVASWWWADTLLALQFGASHSLLLWPRVRGRLERVIPKPLYGCCFTAATCLSLLLLILAWQPGGVVLYRLEGWAAAAVRAVYVLTGYGFQTGWTPFWAWLRRRPPPPRRFTTPGAYRFLRHPVYLSFLAQVWLTPVLTSDRALLTAVFTAYILLGSCLKDRRLLFYLGDTYREYQARVPGYPLAFGPLGRVAPRPEVPREPPVLAAAGR
jgi:methanethiol S-methyltransferase